MTVSRATKPLCAFLFGVALLLALASQAQAAAPAWTVRISNAPGTFERLEKFGTYTVAYNVAVENSGDEATTGSYTLTDTPPGQLAVTAVNAAAGWSCTSTEEVISGAPLSCHSEAVLAPGSSAAAVTVLMSMSPSAPDTVVDEATVSGGGAPAAAASDLTPVVNRAPFEIQDFTARSFDEEGNDDTVAGGHPYEGIASFSFPTYPSVADSGLEPVEDVEDIITELPPGFAGNASAFPRCPLIGLESPFSANCPAASQIGTLALGTHGVPATPSALYNMVPEDGFPAEFAFKFANDAVVIFPRLRPRTGGYGLDLVTPGAARLGITSIEVTLWGVPSVHNGVGGPPAPLLFNPVDCQETHAVTTNIADTWQNPARQLPGVDFGLPDLSDSLWTTTTFPSPPVTGCESPALTSQFHPSIDVKPVQPTAAVQADQPAGLKVALDFPQTNDPTDLKTVFDPALPQAPELKNATVTLPAGVSISPSAADGLVGCSDQAGDPPGDQVHYDNTEPASCPGSSKIGTVLVTSPLLASHEPVSDAVNGAEPIGGDVYLLKPHPGDLTQGQNGTFRVLIQVESPKDGLNVKVPGTVVADRTTGQLTATFTENPQLPISHFELDFNSGPRAPLATPVTCGTFTTTSDMVPWSTPGTPDARPSSAFQVSAGANGAACPATPAQRPFSPALSAGTESSTAGASSPFVLTIKREDGEQELGALNLTMPPGFTAKLAGIPYCSEATIASASAKTGREEEANPSCPLASQVGTLTTGAGPGSNPYYVNGNAYLAGPYKGAPLSLVFITPAVAGPLDLGSVVVRAAVLINPATAQVTVKTDPIPQIIDGIPLRVRSIVARIDRPGFTLNPTSCASMGVTGEAAGSSGATAALSSHFQVGSCNSLKFAPKFSVSTSGRTSKANGASLSVKLVPPHEGPQAGAGQVEEANLAKVKVELPRTLPSRLTTLQKACTAAQFAANPAGCPKESVVGMAVAHTPILSSPLVGPAYFVSRGGEAFPQLIVVLQGENITVDLAGNTFISKTGITSSTFATVPDVPISSFELSLPQGKFSALAANGSLCAQKLAMPTEFVAQNGAVIHQSTPIEVTGCSTSFSITSHSIKQRTLTLKVYVPAAGKLTASGKGVSKASKSAGGRETLTLTLKQAKAGKLRTKINLSFAPKIGKTKSAKKQAKSLQVKFKK